MGHGSYVHSMPCINFLSHLLSMTCTWWPSRETAPQRTRMEPSPQHDRAMRTPPRGYGEGQYMFRTFGVLAPKCQGAHCLTITITSQPECHSSPPTEVILVRPTPHLPSCLLIPCCQDEEKVRTIVTRLLGEFLSETE